MRASSTSTVGWPRTANSIIVCGLSLGVILAIHHAASYACEVTAMGLYAPTLWLDGWGIPWYSALFTLIT